MIDSTFSRKAIRTRPADNGGDLMSELFAATPLAIFLAALKATKRTTFQR